MYGRDWPFPKKMFAKTATLPPCYYPWQFIDSPGVQTLIESRGNWQITGPSLPETINQPDALDASHVPQGLAAHSRRRVRQVRRV
jgi:hypothetical protein